VGMLLNYIWYILGFAIGVICASVAIYKQNLREPGFLLELRSTRNKHVGLSKVVYFKHMISKNKGQEVSCIKEVWVACAFKVLDTPSGTIVAMTMEGAARDTEEEALEDIKEMLGYTEDVNWCFAEKRYLRG